MSNPIPPYVAPFKPLNNVTPFTIRDGYTYARKLEDIIVYLNEVIAYINTEVPGLGDTFEEEVNRLTDVINAALADQNETVTDQLAANLAAVQAAIQEVIDNSLTVNDPLIASAINTGDTQTRVALDTRYALASALASLSAEIEALDLDDINAAFNGRLSESTLNSTYAAKSVETIVTTGRLTDANLNTKVDTRAAAIMDANLDPDVAALIGVDSQARTALDGRYRLASTYIGRQIQPFTTQNAMNVAGGTDGDLAIVNNIPGAIFRRNLGAWMMEGTAIFGTSIARDAAITAPLATMKSRIATEDFDRVYNGTRWNPYGAGPHLISTVNINTPATIGVGTFTDDFANYYFELDYISVNAEIAVLFQLRSAGANVTTNYNSRFIEGSSANTTPTAAVTSAFSVGRTGTSGGINTFTIFSPKLSRPTKMLGNGYDAAGNLRTSGGIHTIANQYTDWYLDFNGAASVSGTLRIYGKN